MLPVGVTVLRLVWLTGLDAHAEVAPVFSDPVSSAGQSSSSVSDGGSDGVECSVVTVVEPASELLGPGSECVAVVEPAPELLGLGSECVTIVELEFELLGPESERVTVAELEPELLGF